MKLLPMMPLLLMSEMHASKLLASEKTCFCIFSLSGWIYCDVLLIRVWLCRCGWNGRKAWERSGWLGEVPEGL